MNVKILVFLGSGFVFLFIPDFIKVDKCSQIRALVFTPDRYWIYFF